MLAIKYLAKKEGSWMNRQMTKKCKTWIGTGIQMYIFNDLIASLFHIALMIVFGVLSNFLDETLMINLMTFAGIIPFLATMLPYLIGGLIVNPIRNLIKKWPK